MVISQIFCLNFQLLPYFEYVSSKGSDETGCLRGLVRALAARLRDKYQTLKRLLFYSGFVVKWFYKKKCSVPESPSRAISTTMKYEVRACVGYQARWQGATHLI